MRARSVLILFLIVAALLAFIWFFERELPSSDQREELSRRAIACQADEVNVIEVERQGQRLRIVRAPRESGDDGSDEAEALLDDEWLLEEPLAGRADIDLVDGLLSELEALEKLRVLEDVEDSNVGLDSPRALVRLYTDDGVTTLQVGSEVPASETMIVGVDDESVFVVSDSLWDDLSHEPGDWRSKDLYRGERDSIQSLTLDAGSVQIRLTRRGDEFWIEEPLEDRADREKVGSLLGAIVGLRVSSFVDEPEGPLSELGLEPPRATIEVSEGPQGPPFHLDWGLPVEEGGADHFARVDGQVFATKAPLAESLKLSPAEWRSLDLITLETRNIDTVRVLDEEGEVLLQRAGADWNRDGKKISFTVVSDLLYALVDARAVAIEDVGTKVDGKNDVGAPILEITLSGAEREETLALGPSSEDVARARVSGRAPILVVPSEVVDEIRTKLDGIRRPEAVEGESGSERDEDLGAPIEGGSGASELPQVDR
jgi:hypothetical protein